MIAGYGLLLMAWSGANPPGSGPDEPAHHVKAVATASGQFTGEPVTNLEGHPPIRRPFLTHVLQTFRIPRRLAVDPRWGCNAFTPNSAACLKAPLGVAPETADGEAIEQQSILGPYIPAPYAILGLAARAAGGPTAGLYAERAAAALISLALLAIVLALVPAQWTRLAVLLAISPTVLFISSVANTSGIEISAALAHTAAVLGLADRPIGQGPWRTWAVTGAILVLARPLGPLWLAGSFALLIALAGSAGLSRRLRAERTTAIPAIILLGSCALFALGWAVLVMPTVYASVGTAADHAGRAVRSFPDLVTQAVGVFGWLDVRLPVAIVLTVGGGWAALLGAAMVRGSSRDRAVLGSMVTALVGLVIVLQTFTQMPFGFGAQARYVLPLALAALIVAGRVIDRTSNDDPGRHVRRNRVQSGIIVGVAGLQWTAWYINAHRSAVGIDGPWLFLESSDWEPLGGWLPWMGAAAIGSVLIGLGSIRARASLACIPTGEAVPPCPEDREWDHDQATQADRGTRPGRHG